MKAVIDKDIAMAWKAISEGAASGAQQKLALHDLLFNVCRLREQSHVPEKPGETAFNEGRRYVGLYVGGAIDAQPAQISKRQEAAK